MAISAKDVNKLRQMTGAGMMDCKKALEEAGGDFEKAVELLRKKGQKVSEKRADRDATEGAVFAHVTDDGKQGVMFQLSCETDFVARADDFQNLGNSILNAAASNKPATQEELMKIEIDGRPIEGLLTDAMGRIGEKIEIKKYALLSADAVVEYIHPGARVGVLVAFNGNNGTDVSQLGRDVAMQIASMKPIAIDKDGVDEATVAKEIEIGKELARKEGKPENIVEKIAMGKLNKFYKENTLLNQEFVKDPSKTIAQHIKETGAGISVVAFERMHLGD